MSDTGNIKIVAFVGLPGSGKSTATEYISQKQIPRVYFGGVVLEAVEKAGLDINPRNEQYMREKLRADEGNDVIVNRIVEQIQNLISAGQKRIIADGLYSWTEYKIMKKAFPGELTVIAVVSPRRSRYRRLADRPTRPLTEREATERDWAEIERLEKGGPIAMADSYIINDGTIEELYEEIDTKLKQIEFFD
jgi:dephospho-CoA kinase